MSFIICLNVSKKLGLLSEARGEVITVLSLERRYNFVPGERSERGLNK